MINIDNTIVVAYWSGSWPSLCCGEWSLKIGDKDVSYLIPEDLRNSSMNTFGTYQSWYFDDDWMEVFESYDDGLDCESWIEENNYWLSNITNNDTIKESIYYAIQDSDFRSGSCGGCI